VNEDLVLVPEVRARRVLGKQRIRLRMLVPYGAWVGCGALRVLRVKPGEPDESAGGDREVEMTVGYESYRS
jgi:hypothetical protein